MMKWKAKDRYLVDGTNPKIMGIVNVTPDSFSDGGCFASAELAVKHALFLAEEGADLLDIGGESSRPGASIVPLEEELRRVVPVIEEIARSCPLPISVDTVKPAVARAALHAGAMVINDIEGFADKPDLLRIAADSAAGVVVMHMAGDPRTMQFNPTYHDVVTEVYDFLGRRVEAIERAGVEREQIAIDPGIGFGKTFEHNLELLRNLNRFTGLGCAILIGTSRKGFLGTITGRPRDQRATASAVSGLQAILNGASVVRVHDVGPMADALKVWASVQGWDESR